MGNDGLKPGFNRHPAKRGNLSASDSSIDPANPTSLRQSQSEISQFSILLAHYLHLLLFYGFNYGVSRPSALPSRPFPVKNAGTKRESTAYDKGTQPIFITWCRERYCDRGRAVRRKSKKNRRWRLGGPESNICSTRSLTLCCHATPHHGHRKTWDCCLGDISSSSSLCLCLFLSVCLSVCLCLSLSLSFCLSVCFSLSF